MPVPGRPFVALEITPPRGPKPGVLLRRASLLGGHADVVNVIERAGRQSSLDACIELLNAGLQPVCHLVTRGLTAAQLERNLERAACAGIERVLCIKGEGRAGINSGLSVREAIRLTRQRLPTAALGATLNQYNADRAAVLRNLLPKLEAGATTVQTQPVLDVAALVPYAETIAAFAPGTGLVPMVMPLLSPEAANRIGAKLGICLPHALLQRLDHGAEAGWEIFGETLNLLVGLPGLTGIAVMTFEADPPPATGAAICAALEKFLEGALRAHVVRSRRDRGLLR